MLFGQSRQNPWLGILKTIPLFSQLTPSEIRVLESLVHERQYDTDEIVFDDGEEGLGLYVVISGCIAICKTSKGTRRELAKLGPGMFFGEMALLEGDGTPRSAQARACEPSQLIGFFRPEFLGLLKTNRSIAAKVSYELARHMAHRLREQVLQQAGPIVSL